jgi:hypothetical protein
VLKSHGLDLDASDTIQAMRNVLARRNVLAHSPLMSRLKGPVRPLPLAAGETFKTEFYLVKVTKRGTEFETVDADSLHDDLDAVTGVMMDSIALAKRIVEAVPRPVRFQGGQYIANPDA